MSQDWPQRWTGTTRAGRAAFPLRHLQLSFERVHRHVEGGAVDVDEVDARAAIERAVGTGDEAYRRGPYPVARLDAERQAGDVQRAGGAVHGDGVVRAAIGRDALLECGKDFPLREEIGPQHGGDGFDVLVAYALSAVGDHCAHSSVPAQTLKSGATCSRMSVRISSTLRK